MQTGKRDVLAMAEPVSTEEKSDRGKAESTSQSAKATVNKVDAAAKTDPKKGTNQTTTVPSKSDTSDSKQSNAFVLPFVESPLRLLFFELPLIFLFASFLAVLVLHKVHDDYLYRQLKLMRFIPDGRDYTDVTYYHRVCDGADVTATSVSQLLIPENATAKECAEHQMYHGASMYRNLLTPQTAHELREFIVEENQRQEGWFVIQNKNRYSWGIDVNMHPAFKKYWKELGSNEQLVNALQAILGTDPAVVEFTAITSSYGAVDQHDHQDVIPPGSGTKFARTYVPTYSLFIPLQNTSYDMGATHVCPGTQLCSDGCDQNCYKYNLAMSGENDNWQAGWGALVNQQTTHKGMGHTKEGGLDRVVLIATFSPRPQTFRGLETRMIGMGGSYSLLWTQWGHTFSDYVNADTRMWEPQRTMRSLGLLKGGGWNMISVASMRIANDDNGYNDDGMLEDFEDSGGFIFLPRSWQGSIKGMRTGAIDNPWYSFLVGTMKRTEHELRKLNFIAIALYFAVLIIVDIIWPKKNSDEEPTVMKGIRTLALSHGLLVIMAILSLYVIAESNWAKDIRNMKSYRLPPLEIDAESEYPLATLPTESDVLLAPHYASDSFAAYSRVVDFAHPGNRYWYSLVRQYAVGYAALSPPLRFSFCQTLMESLQVNRRVLKQDKKERVWTQITEESELSEYCHKELLQASSGTKEALLRQLTALKTETEYGRFHRTAMQQETTPKYLEKWESRLLEQPQEPKSMPKATVSFSVRSAVSSAISTIGGRNNRIVYSLPVTPEREEPFPGAWLEEGDDVEGRYKCAYNEWYRGTISTIFANDATIDVEYHDGDVNNGLERRCVRPFEPYDVDDDVEVQDSDGKFYLGKIVAVDEYGTMDVETEEKGILEDVEEANVRRLDLLTPIHEGDRVDARYNGGREWFPAVVDAVNGDGTYDVVYDDGDFEASLPEDMVERRHTN